MSRRKFGVPMSPFEADYSEPGVQPTPGRLHAEKRQYAQRLFADQPNSENYAIQAEIKRQIAKEDWKGLDNKIQSDFEHRFDAYLLGRMDDKASFSGNEPIGTENDPVWSYRNLSHIRDPEVHEYIKSKVDARAYFEQYLIFMKTFGPIGYDPRSGARWRAGLFEHYIYFKYVLEENAIEENDYLKYYKLLDQDRSDGLNASSVFKRQNASDDLEPVHYFAGGNGHSKFRSTGLEGVYETGYWTKDHNWSTRRAAKMQNPAKWAIDDYFGTAPAFIPQQPPQPQQPQPSNAGQKTKNLILGNKSQKSNQKSAAKQRQSKQLPQTPSTGGGSKGWFKRSPRSQKSAAPPTPRSNTAQGQRTPRTPSVTVTPPDPTTAAAPDPTTAAPDPTTPGLGARLLGYLTGGTGKKSPTPSPTPSVNSTSSKSSQVHAAKGSQFLASPRSTPSQVSATSKSSWNSQASTSSSGQPGTFTITGLDDKTKKIPLQVGEVINPADGVRTRLADNGTVIKFNKQGQLVPGKLKAGEAAKVLIDELKREDGWENMVKTMRDDQIKARLMNRLSTSKDKVSTIQTQLTRQLKTLKDDINGKGKKN